MNRKTYNCSSRCQTMDMPGPSLTPIAVTTKIVGKDVNKSGTSIIQKLMPQGFPTSYAQLVVSVFFLGSFIGETVLDPISQVCGRRSAIMLAVAAIAATGALMSHLNHAALLNVVRILQILAAAAGVISLVYSLSGSAQSMPFDELLNVGKHVKELLIILTVGMMLGTFSTQIKQCGAYLMAQHDATKSNAIHFLQNSLGTALAPTALDKSRKLDKAGVDMVSSEEYLFSDLCE